jgi:hypothetical protein
MKCPECGSPFGRHRGGCRRGAVEGIAEFWRPLGWIGRLLAAVMYVGVILFFGKVAYEVGQHNGDLALVLAMGGLAIIVVLALYIRLCLTEGLRFFFSRIGAVGAVFTAVLWGIWYLVFLAAMNMKPGGNHPILAYLGRAAMLAPILVCFFVLFVGGGVAIVVAVRRAVNPQPEPQPDSEPYLAQELSGGSKLALTGFVVVVATLLGYGAWSGLEDISSDLEHANSSARGNGSAPARDLSGQNKSRVQRAGSNEASQESATCNVGSYTANAGTLHLYTPEIDVGTREMVVNGVDLARPTVPFRFTWGDGTMTVGWFPQKKIYKTRPYSKDQNCYQVWVVANHPDGSTAEAAIAVSR